MLLAGETVQVIRRHDCEGEDEYGNALYSFSTEDVDNVLVQPSVDPENVIESNRPEGRRANYLLHFPKTYEGDVTGCTIIVRDRKTRVVGTPDRWDGHICPTAWNMRVEVEAVDG